MKKFNAIILTIIVTCTIIHAYPQSYDQNFTNTNILRVPNNDESSVQNLSVAEKTEIIKYFDGLGRSAQTINKMGSPGLNDMVWFNIYDEYGRTPKQYLPFTIASNNGNYLDDIITDQSDFFENTLHIAHTHHPFSVTEFENSPLQKITEQGTPGYWWQPDLGGHTMKYEYTFNQVNEVRKWEIDPYSGYCLSTTTYLENTLYVKIIKDQNWDGENGGLVKEYRDKTGRLILKANRLNDNTSLKTCYVYDEFNNLRFIITPKAIENMEAQGSYNTNALTEELVYEFIYDEKQRVIEKRIPGMEEVYLVYDKVDRVIMQQNGNLRQDNKWEFIKYDVYGRSVMTGICIENTLLTRQAIQGHVNNNTYPLFESFTGITSSPPHGYTNQAYPLLDGNSEILNVLYYDNYDFDASLTYDYNNFTDELGNEPFYRIKGKLTGSKTAILGSDPVTYLFSVFYYDKKGRMIRGISDNHLGGIDYGDFNYLFSGEIRMANTYHNTIINGQQESDVIKWSYSYDHAGRLLEVLQGINTLPDQTILMNKYNELGQLIEKNIHRTPTDDYLQSVDYKYNISGMLKNINHSNLTNQSKVIDFEEELSPDEIVYGIKYDSIYFTVNEVEESVNNPAYLNVLINDVKQILVCHENDTSQKRSISVNESQLYVLEKPITDSLTYHKLRELYRFEFDFILDSVSFDNNTLQSVIIDSLMILIEPQFYASGISDSTVVEQGMKQLSLFLYKSTGVIYFNEDPNDLFGMDLLYEEGFNVLGGSNMFNGHISGMKWQEKYFDGEKGYGYQYDNLYRLTNANYGEKTDGSWDPNNSFSVSGIEYDFNGNITQLSRSGLVDFKTVQEYGPIDELVYSYDGNHLKSVDDNIPIPSFSENDFNDNGTYNSEEYFYDANGNMVQDDNKGIENIVYNYLNLPQEITLSGNRKIEYIYDASGNKLTQVIKVNGQVVDKTDYINGYIYKDDELECVMFGEGRAVKQTDGTFRNEYFLTDHLGNVRIMFSDTDEDGEADIVREHHYYPYGMKMGGFNFISGAENNYLYQGKELQSAHNLLWYDFGARYFDHQLGRWHSIDPALQFSSPYVGMGNNPVIFTDPDGRYVDGDIAWVVDDLAVAEITATRIHPASPASPNNNDQNMLWGYLNGWGFGGGGYGGGNNNNQYPNHTGGGIGSSSSGHSTQGTSQWGEVPPGEGSDGSGLTIFEQIEMRSEQVDGLIEANVASLEEGTYTSFWDGLKLEWNLKLIGRGFPDLISIDINLGSTAIAGASMTYSLNFFTRGELGFNITSTEQNRFGGEIDWGINLNLGYYQGNPLNINQSSVAGPVESISAGWGYSAQGYFGYDATGRHIWTGFGVGIGLSGGASYGSGSTRIIWP